MNDELYADMERIANVIDEVQKKHNGIYMTACHREGEREMLAMVTVKVDGKYEYYAKWADDHV